MPRTKLEKGVQLSQKGPYGIIGQTKHQTNVKILRVGICLS